MLSSRVPDLRALEMLVTLERAGTIARTAAELRLTQQAVSARLRRLEESLGIALAVRGVRETGLTPAGLSLVKWARPVLEAADRLDSEIGVLIDGGSPRIRVAASMTVAEFLLPHWLVAFRRSRLGLRLPVVEVEVTATNTARASALTAAGDADLGFVEGPARPEGLQYRLLARDELVVVARPDHPWSRHGEADAATVAATALVMREPGSGCRNVLLRAIEHAGVDHAAVAAPAIELPSNTAIAETVADGLAPAAISIHAVRHMIRSGRLVHIRVPDLDLRRDLGAVWRHGAEPADPAARDLLAACSSAGVPAAAA